MFEVKPKSNFSTEEKLLYNIWQEQIKTNEMLSKSNEPVVINEEVIKDVEPKIEIDLKKEEFKCKHCEETFENKGKLMAHYKTHKKERGNNEQPNTTSKGKKSNSK